MPRGILDTSLHDREIYMRMSSEFSPLLANVSIIGMNKSFVQDRDVVDDLVKKYGWRLVDTAFVNASESGAGGAQVSHLIQQPDTLECLMTFQGSSSYQDWVGNLDVAKSHFCGLVDPYERCDDKLSRNPCRVRKPRGSFVHRGFRNHFRRMVQSDEWQRNIRPNLQFCSTVSVTGHSLGAALSELFTACSAKAPRPREYGYDEDYKYISWTTAGARKLKYKE
jgi:hypothetical protein